MVICALYFKAGNQNVEEYPKVYKSIKKVTETTWFLTYDRVLLSRMPDFQKPFEKFKENICWKYIDTVYCQTLLLCCEILCEVIEQSFNSHNWRKVMKHSGRESTNFRVSACKWVNHNPCFLFSVAALAVLHFQSWKVQAFKGKQLWFIIPW